MTITLADLQDEPGHRDAGLVVVVQPATSSRAIEFDLVYSTHYRDVYRYVLGLTRSIGDAEDITADTFERALRHWPDVPERPLPWLLLAARRIATDRWRRARRFAEIVLAGQRGAVAVAPAPDPEFDGWFDAVSAVLTGRQREVLVLRYQRDLTDADIATVMGLSESGVRSLVARALDVLRAHPELLT